MIAVVVALLLAATVAGVVAARRGAGGTAGLLRAAVPAILVGATGEDEPATDSAAEESAPDDSDGPGPDGEAGEGKELPASPLRGGLSIGVLERAAIAVCVLANFGGGLAVIVAAKGLARYPELRHPGAAEQFIIGTFVSVLWAVACAGVAVALGR
ncbi:hypothetical protein FK530_14050 [Tsukamurella conjunctivitidis]|uniref:DUF4190 domain-containing protein n=1 Tax=Tsukamurella conjunctivitidis TaxID=2592068 RepID=A0A5C5S0J1_9ACTN|nr:hypothetical protein [Tsukamurella conjunctivitidis]TWS28200.1 hypothetical protein FK530_14050 [Tsukamurella conjunctivitidis]